MIETKPTDTQSTTRYRRAETICTRITPRGKTGADGAAAGCDCGSGVSWPVICRAVTERTPPSRPPMKSGASAHSVCHDDSGPPRRAGGCRDSARHGSLDSFVGGIDLCPRNGIRQEALCRYRRSSQRKSTARQNSMRRIWISGSRRLAPRWRLLKQQLRRLPRVPDSEPRRSAISRRLISTRYQRLVKDGAVAQQDYETRVSVSKTSEALVLCAAG